MKITDLVAKKYQWKTTTIRNGKYTYSNGGMNLMEIHTDEGIVGYGPGAQRGDGPAIAAEFRPLLIGEDPMNVNRLWQKMWQPKLVGRRGMSTRVISAIDIALWDTIGKALNQPLHKLLGGYADRVPCYIAGGYYMEGKGLDGLAKEMEDNLKIGAKAVKMKIGGASIAEDVERVRVARETVGPDIKLMIDANNAYRYYEAIQIAKKVEKYDIYWFEEPVMPDDYEGHAKIAAATSIPVATGENEYTRYGFRDLIKANAAAILQPDANIMGGVTEWIKVAAIASAHDLPVAPHGSHHIHVHLVAAVPNGLMVEYGRSRPDSPSARMYKQEQTLDKDGMLTPPNRPGLGFDLDLDAIDQYRIA